jgi:hypothetical protein
MRGVYAEAGSEGCVGERLETDRSLVTEVLWASSPPTAIP